jgi:hypothetical protein
MNTLLDNIALIRAGAFFNLSWPKNVYVLLSIVFIDIYSGLSEKL